MASFRVDEWSRLSLTWYNQYTIIWRESQMFGGFTGLCSPNWCVTGTYDYYFTMKPGALDRSCTCTVWFLRPVSLLLEYQGINSSLPTCLGLARRVGFEPTSQLALTHPLSRRRRCSHFGIYGNTRHIIMRFTIKLHRLLATLGFEPKTHAPNAKVSCCVCLWWGIQVSIPVFLLFRQARAPATPTPQ